MRRELERRHDAEVPAAATETPVQVGMLIRARGHDVAVGRDHLCGEQVVATQPVLPAMPAHAPREGQSCDPGLGDDPDRHGEAVGLRRGIQIAERRAAGSTSRPARRVDLHLTHR